MGKKSKRKAQRRIRRPPLDSETETGSSEGFNSSNISENYHPESPPSNCKRMKDEDIPDFQQLLSPPREVLGLSRFYTDEFDAFRKYYSIINQCRDDNSVAHLVKSLEHLPYESCCKLSEKVKRIPKKDNQNIEVPAMAETNDQIEFAHPCIKIAETHDKGKHLIASSKVEKGEILIDERATVLQVNPICLCMEGEHKMYRCHHCAYAD